MAEERCHKSPAISTNRGAYFQKKPARSLAMRIRLKFGKNSPRFFAQLLVPALRPEEL